MGLSGKDMADWDGVPRRIRGWRRRRRHRALKTSVTTARWTTICLLLLMGLSWGVNYVSAAPVAQIDIPPLLDASSSTTSTSTASPIPTASAVSVISTSTSSTGTSSSSISATTTLIPGTVVTDSPLVRTRSLSSDSASASGSSALNSSLSLLPGSAASPTSSSSTSIMDTKTPVPSPTTNENDTPNDTPQAKTYNSLVNFYFLILAAAIGFAVLGWWLWRRRRKGKTTRDQRRGLEALRRDMELGRLRRGFRGVVGRGNTHSVTNVNVNEELPAYQPVRSLPVAVTRPPGYEEAVTSGRTTSVGDELHPT